MEISIIVHEAQEGGYWAEVPHLPGCATQGDTLWELLRNLAEAIEGRLDQGQRPLRRSPILLLPFSGVRT